MEPCRLRGPCQFLAIGDDCPAGAPSMHSPTHPKPTAPATPLSGSCILGHYSPSLRPQDELSDSSGPPYSLDLETSLLTLPPPFLLEEATVKAFILYSFIHIISCSFCLPTHSGASLCDPVPWPCLLPGSCPCKFLPSQQSLLCLQASLCLF